MASPSSVSLYQLEAAFLALEADLMESGGEWTEQTEAAFAALGELEAGKMDAFACVIRNAEADAALFGNERDAFAAKATAAATRAKRLKARLLEYLQARDLKELRGHLWRATVTPNGGKQPVQVLAPVDELPEGFVVTERRPDTESLRAACEASNDGILRVKGVPVAELLPRGSHLRIR